MTGMDTSEQGALTAARSDERAFRSLVEPYRRELRAHCYRMSGSMHDADDLVQESMLRAWRGLASFEGRASLRTWLHRVTTNACLDALEKKSARVVPRELGPAVEPSTPMAPDNEIPWLEPCPDDLIDDAPASPEARYDARESVALAFLTALQHLPPRQRAVLLLRDVLGHEASECAELLETSVASVNSALQRARETLAQRPISDRPPEDETTSALLARYVSAWEQADVSLLVSILREDATLAMPPFASWLSGRDGCEREHRARADSRERRAGVRDVRTRSRERSDARERDSRADDSRRRGRGDRRVLGSDALAALRAADDALSVTAARRSSRRTDARLAP